MQGTNVWYRKFLRPPKNNPTSFLWTKVKKGGQDEEAVTRVVALSMVKDVNKFVAATIATADSKVVV